MIKKSIVGLVVCLLALAGSAWAQTQHVLDTGDPAAAERVCNPKSYTDLDNGIVRDNVTGLEWQQATAPGTYTWQQAQDYITSLNDAKYLGYEDWRLPTVEELSSLVDVGRIDPPAINPIFNDTVEAYYWSSTTYAYDAGSAWSVGFGADDFFNGFVNCNIKSDNYYVRAVRGGQYGSLDNFVINGDGTVTDNNTGLMWQPCNYGQALSGTECTGTAATRTWAAAFAYVQELNTTNYLDYGDWRLPTKNELQSIVNYSLYNPATTFPNMAEDFSGHFYWSSTTELFRNHAWSVAFGDGSVGNIPKTIGFYVRAVRGGSCRADGDWCIDENDCPDGSACVDGACDQPPVFLSEPLWVGPWMGLSSDPAYPGKPQSKDILFWAYDDDNLACRGVEISWKYRPVALLDGEVVALSDWIVKEPWRFLWFVWIETPGIANIPSGPGLFEFKMTLTDCMGQMVDSEGFWGKRYYFQIN